MIHYNESWARDVEGHRGLVVHGPLNLINIMDYWRDVCAGKDFCVAKEVNYRALSPLYAGDVYTIRGTETGSAAGGEQSSHEVLVQLGGTLCMKAEVTAGLDTI
jgi:hydroxyacyl-ACP dehydratase HTD2-like protein with hotdog domain